MKHRIHSEACGTFCQVLGKRYFLSPKTAKFGVTCILLSVPLLCSNCLGGSPHIVVKNEENIQKKIDQRREEMRNGNQKRERERSNNITWVHGVSVHLYLEFPIICYKRCHHLPLPPNYIGSGFHTFVTERDLFNTHMSYRYIFLVCHLLLYFLWCFCHEFFQKFFHVEYNYEGY